MPLLTPLRLRGSRDPVLKEANYFQYLPHSREARSSRGQACETFLQPASLPAQSCPVLFSPSLSLLLQLIFLLLPRSALLTFFSEVSIWITLFNMLSLTYFHFCRRHGYSAVHLKFFVWLGDGRCWPTLKS